jgi:hypothetical protein
MVEAVKHSTHPGDIVQITWSEELNRRLAIPVDTRVECWNGQEWTLTYLALGIGGSAEQTRAVEAGQGAEASRDRAVVDTPAANILIPLIAPGGTYRVMNIAELYAVSSERDCTTVPFEVQFRVARTEG